MRSTVKRILLNSVFEAFDYVMDHYAPYGMEDMVQRDDTYAVISIQDAQSDGFGFEFTESRYCREVLTLRFDDVESDAPGSVPFSGEMAEEMIRFILRNREADTLLIHCYAGQSRSRAAAAFAVRMFGKDDSAYFQGGRPNRLVYETLEKIWAEKQGRSAGER